jgi:peptide methionine sulfoxide reductase MsrA
MTTGASTLSIGNSQLTEEKMKQLDAVIKAYEAQMKAEIAKSKAKELTKTQKRIAEKLNVSYDDYAKKIREIDASA